ncbi:MAG: hypothetical protein CMI17_07315 [Opitutaceae bacterium]|nr:hypothetical protein [Opitutaceae bacterium]
MKFQPRKPGGVESKREIWRSKIDKPMGPGMLLTLIPTLIMCVFLVMAAPYLKSITLKFFEMDREEVLLPVELAEDLEPELPTVPPPNPDVAIAELYQKQFDEQGFDWRTPPKIELPKEEKEEIIKEIKMVEVDLPLLINAPDIDFDQSGLE